VLAQCAEASPATGTPEAPGRRALSRRSACRLVGLEVRLQQREFDQVVLRAAAADTPIFGGERGKRLAPPPDCLKHSMKITGGWSNRSDQ
jgi:hypothetical protein